VKGGQNWIDMDVPDVIKSLYSSCLRGLGVAEERGYPLWFWVFLGLLVALFVLVLATDPYYRQVPLWGID